MTPHLLNYRHNINTCMSKGWKVLPRVLLIVIFCMAGIPSIFAQENYEIQVYQSDLIKPHQTMFELHSNTTLKKTSENDLFSQNFFRETVEITHGFCKWFELGSYLFTNIGTHGSSDIVGVHLRPRLAIPEDKNLPVGISVSTEIGYAKKKYSDPPWTLELRPILDKKFDRLLLALNAVFSWGLSKNSDHTTEFGAAFKSSCDVSHKLALGVEYYGGYGALTEFLPYKQEQHQLFGVIDVDFGPEWEFNSGLGWGLTESSDRLIIKFIFGRRFGF